MEINENKQSTNAILPNFATQVAPVGKKGNVKLVRISKNLNILTDHVSYEFRTTVTDHSVKLWVLILKMYNDSNFKELEEMKSKDIVSVLLADQHTAVFSIRELAHSVYGKRVESKRLLKLLDAISDIKINIVRDGKLVGVTNFCNSPYIHKDKKHIQVNFNSLMLYAMMQNFRLMNMKKYLALNGSASRLYLVMQGWKKHSNGKGEYVKITHQEICNAMGVDANGVNTKSNLLKDYIACGIDFIYHRFGDYWYFKDDLLK